MKLGASYENLTDRGRPVAHGARRQCGGAAHASAGDRNPGELRRYQSRTEPADSFPRRDQRVRQPRSPVRRVRPEQRRPVQPGLQPRGGAGDLAAERHVLRQRVPGGHRRARPDTRVPDLLPADPVLPVRHRHARRRLCGSQHRDGPGLRPQRHAPGLRHADRPPGRCDALPDPPRTGRRAGGRHQQPQLR